MVLSGFDRKTSLNVNCASTVDPNVNCESPVDPNVNSDVNVTIDMPHIPIRDIGDYVCSNRRHGGMMHGVVLDAEP